MRLRGRIARLMFMLMVDVMHVPVLMLERLMQMLVLVRFGEVQIDADPHQQRRADEAKGQRLAEQWERKSRADEGGSREVSARADGSQMTKAEYKEHETNAIAE